MKTLVMDSAHCIRKRQLYRDGRARTVLCGTLCVLFLLSGCSVGGGPPPAYVAVVNGEKIYLPDFKRKIERALKLFEGSSALGPAEATRLQEEVLSGLINEKVMLLRARELSLSVSEEELMKWVREIKKDYSDGSFNEILAAEKIDYGIWREELRNRLLLEKLIDADVNARVSVTEEEGKAYFLAHPKDYVAKKRVHVAQIIVRDRREAEEILRRLKKGEDFGRVAREVSIGPEASLGGDLGFFGRGVMPEPIDKAVFSLSFGGISGIVKSPFGYHIFKLLARDEGGTKSFPEVREKILTDIKKQKEEKAYTGWLTELRARAVIKRNEELLKGISLPGAPAGNRVR